MGRQFCAHARIKKSGRVKLEKGWSDKKLAKKTNRQSGWFARFEWFYTGAFVKRWLASLKRENEIGGRNSVAGGRLPAERHDPPPAEKSVNPWSLPPSLDLGVALPTGIACFKFPAGYPAAGAMECNPARMQQPGSAKPGSLTG
jgi:hypothetical protein